MAAALGMCVRVACMYMSSRKTFYPQVFSADGHMVWLKVLYDANIKTEGKTRSPMAVHAVGVRRVPPIFPSASHTLLLEVNES